MFQTVDGVDCFVVDLKEIPELPIIPDLPGTEMYAQALTLAIENGIITEPGKYGINLTDSGKMYNIFGIIEK